MEQEEINLINYSSFDEKYKKILITGGLGFIGSALVFRLLKKTTAKVFNIDKLIQKSNLLSFNKASISTVDPPGPKVLPKLPGLRFADKFFNSEFTEFSIIFL